MLLNLSLCHLALDHYFRAFWYACRAEDEIAGRWEIERLKGMIFFTAGKHLKAIKSLVASFEPNTTKIGYKPFERDDTAVWNTIGESFYRLGQYFEAHQAFKRAAEFCKEAMPTQLLKDRAALMLEMSKNLGR